MLIETRNTNMNLKLRIIYPFKVHFADMTMFCYLNKILNAGLLLVM